VAASLRPSSGPSGQCNGSLEHTQDVPRREKGEWAGIEFRAQLGLGLLG
jgi:hypothetical protein